MKYTHAFSGFSVVSIENAKQFYGTILGIEIEERPEGLMLNLNGTQVFLYEKPDHQPATFTVLNFEVEDIDQTVKELKEKGLAFESMPGITDDLGIARGREAGRGPDIAWFKDPSGNFLSVLH